jgi:uncharacterized membrane protein
MVIKEQVEIEAPKEAIWQVITDIENSVNNITGIEKVEILEQPAEGLVGLKWRETRTLFSSTATEVMWITEAVENEFYQTRAESHGAVYISRLYIAESDGKNFLAMEFQSRPQTFGAKLMGALMGWMMKGSTAKALQQDLQDIKAVVEKGQQAAAA